MLRHTRVKSKQTNEEGERKRERESGEGRESVWERENARLFTVVCLTIEVCNNDFMEMEEGAALGGGRGWGEGEEEKQQKEQEEQIVGASLCVAAV